MPKKIKFDLICDGYSIHTIDDLQEHFSIQEVLYYFRSGLLLRWLEVRGYQEEYDAVEAIQETDDTEIMKKLVSIFHIDATEEEIAETMELFRRRESRENRLKNYHRGEQNWKDIVQDVVDEYQDQIEELECFDGADEALKNKTDAFATDFKGLIEMDYDRLFHYLSDMEEGKIIQYLMINPEIGEYLQRNLRDYAKFSKTAKANLLRDFTAVMKKYAKQMGKRK